MPDPGQPRAGRPPRWASRRRGLGLSLLVNTLVTLAVYRLLRPQVGSGTATLAVAAAVPVSWTAARTRRVE